MNNKDTNNEIATSGDHTVFPDTTEGRESSLKLDNTLHSSASKSTSSSPDETKLMKLSPDEALKLLNKPSAASTNDEKDQKDDVDELKPKRKRKSPDVPWKKPEGMPKRPLSAYNLYFRDERQRILQQVEKDKDDAEKNTSTEMTSSSIDETNNEKRGKGSGSSSSRKMKLSPTSSTSSATIASTKKTGVGFAGLTKTISAKWNILSAQEKQPYEEIAGIDKKRYQDAIAIWRQLKKNEKDTQKQLMDNMNHQKKQDNITLTTSTQQQQQQLLEGGGGGGISTSGGQQNTRNITESSDNMATFSERSYPSEWFETDSTTTNELDQQSRQSSSAYNSTPTTTTTAATATRLNTNNPMYGGSSTALDDVSSQHRHNSHHTPQNQELSSHSSGFRGDVDTIDHRQYIQRQQQLQQQLLQHQDFDQHSRQSMLSAQEYDSFSHQAPSSASSNDTFLQRSHPAIQSSNYNYQQPFSNNNMNDNDVHFNDRMHYDTIMKNQQQENDIILQREQRIRYEQMRLEHERLQLQENRYQFERQQNLSSASHYNVPLVDRSTAAHQSNAMIQQYYLRNNASSAAATTQQIHHQQQLISERRRPNNTTSTQIVGSTSINPYATYAIQGRGHSLLSPTIHNTSMRYADENMRETQSPSAPLSPLFGFPLEDQIEDNTNEFHHHNSLSHLNHQLQPDYQSFSPLDSNNLRHHQQQRHPILLPLSDLDNSGSTNSNRDPIPRFSTSLRPRPTNVHLFSEDEMTYENNSEHYDRRSTNEVTSFSERLAHRQPPIMELASSSIHRSASMSLVPGGGLGGRSPVPAFERNPEEYEFRRYSYSGQTSLQQSPPFYNTSSQERHNNLLNIDSAGRYLPDDLSGNDMMAISRINRSNRDDNRNNNNNVWTETLPFDNTSPIIESRIGNTIRRPNNPPPQHAADEEKQLTPNTTERLQSLSANLDTDSINFLTSRTNDNKYQKKK